MATRRRPTRSRCPSYSNRRSDLAQGVSANTPNPIPWPPTSPSVRPPEELLPDEREVIADRLDQVDDEESHLAVDAVDQALDIGLE